MPFEQPIALRCHLSRGGFSSERVIRIPQASGETFIGVAPLEYCFTDQGQPIAPDQPAPGVRMPALVTARKIHVKHDGSVLASVPDGNVISVRPELVTKPPREVAPDVVVQP